MRGALCLKCVLVIKVRTRVLGHQSTRPASSSWVKPLRRGKITFVSLSIGIPSFSEPLYLPLQVQLGAPGHAPHFGQLYPQRPSMLDPVTPEFE